jgi:hypothetical protein
MSSSRQVDVTPTRSREFGGQGGSVAARDSLGKQALQLHLRGISSQHSGAITCLPKGFHWPAGPVTVCQEAFFRESGILCLLVVEQKFTSAISTKGNILGRALLPCKIFVVALLSAIR